MSMEQSQLGKAQLHTGRIVILCQRLPLGERSVPVDVREVTSVVGKEDFLKFNSSRSSKHCKENIYRNDSKID
jgi:hypothetical protein